MLRKYASLEVAQILEVKGSNERVSRAGLDKLADYEDYRTGDGYLYTRVRAISSRVNKNHDGWPSEELAKAYLTFIGKPIFVDHNNSDPTKARGVIVDAKLHIDQDPEKTAARDPYYANAPDNHKPPTWVELLLEVDAKAFPKLARAIIDDDIDGVSMGANVERSKCSHCANWATDPSEYCQHVMNKGAIFDRYDDFGRKTASPAYEDCYDIGFFEISYVFDPADETALDMGDKRHAIAHTAAGGPGGPKKKKTPPKKPTTMDRKRQEEERAQAELAKQVDCTECLGTGVTNSDMVKDEEGNDVFVEGRPCPRCGGSGSKDVTPGLRERQDSYDRLQADEEAPFHGEGGETPAWEDGGAAMGSPKPPTDGGWDVEKKYWVHPDKLPPDPKLKGLTPDPKNRPPARGPRTPVEPSQYRQDVSDRAADVPEDTRAQRPPKVRPEEPRTPPSTEPKEYKPPNPRRPRKPKRYPDDRNYFLRNSKTDADAFINLVFGTMDMGGYGNGAQQPTPLSAQTPGVQPDLPGANDQNCPGCGAAMQDGICPQCGVTPNEAPGGPADLGGGGASNPQGMMASFKLAKDGSVHYSDYDEIEEARHHLRDLYKDDPASINLINSADPDMIMNSIDNTYEGGWKKFLSDLHVSQPFSYDPATQGLDDPDPNDDTMKRLLRETPYNAEGWGDLAFEEPLSGQALDDEVGRTMRNNDMLNKMRDEKETEPIKPTPPPWNGEPSWEYSGDTLADLGVAEEKLHFGEITPEEFDALRQKAMNERSQSDLGMTPDMPTPGDSTMDQMMNTPQAQPGQFEQFMVTRNMVGYMPESEPIVANGDIEAKHAMLDELERYMDQLGMGGEEDETDVIAQLNEAIQDLRTADISQGWDAQIGNEFYSITPNGPVPMDDEDDDGESGYASDGWNKGSNVKIAKDGTVHYAQDPLPQSMMTTAPEAVDTLRQEKVCDVCGSDMDDGKCDVCNYEEPPEGFDNPDLEKAQAIADEGAEAQGMGAPPPGVMAPGEAGGAGPPGAGPPPGSPPPGGPGMTASYTTPLPGFTNYATKYTTSSNNAYTTISSETQVVRNVTAGKIRHNEQPIIPPTKTVSDHPKTTTVVKEPTRLTQSNTTERHMTQRKIPTKAEVVAQMVKRGTNGVKTAEQAEKLLDASGFAPLLAANPASDPAEHHQEVEQVGGEVDNPEKDVQHINVEKAVDIEAIPTKTWSGEKDQTAPVTNEVGDLGGPIGSPVASTKTADGQSGILGDPTNAEKQIDVEKPIGAEGTVAPNTQTFKSDPFHVGDPVTTEDSNQVGGPIGTPMSKGSRAAVVAHVLSALKVAEQMVAEGLESEENKFELAAQLEQETPEQLQVRRDMLAKTHTARKRVKPARLPGLVNGARTAGTNHEVPDDNFEHDSLFR